MNVPALRRLLAMARAHYRDHRLTRPDALRAFDVAIDSLEHQEGAAA